MLLILIASIVVSLSACANSKYIYNQQEDEKGKKPSEYVVQISEIAPKIWLHTSYKMVEPWGLVLTNGLIVEHDSYSVLIDSAWNDELTGQILDWAKNSLNKPISVSIHTHAHSDKMGGIAALHNEGIDTFAHSLSNELAPTRKLIAANNNLGIPQVGDKKEWHGLTVLYPGGGHADDNIVVYHKESRVIFGGCLIRPGSTKSLGFTGDANLKYWSQAVQNVANAFPEANIVIPSHGKPAGREVLTNTINITKPAL